MNKTQQNKIERSVRAILEAIGEDPDRLGLKDTPKRIAQMWKDFAEFDSGNTNSLFRDEGCDIVHVTGMRVWSFCEHHLLPFYCDITVSYTPNQQVLGLSKFARVAHKHAHKLQVQERLVNDIANELIDIIGSQDIAVSAIGEHMCMSMRGVKTAANMISRSLNGRFKEHPLLRREHIEIT